MLEKIKKLLKYASMISIIIEGLEIIVDKLEKKEYGSLKKTGNDNNSER